MFTHWLRRQLMAFGVVAAATIMTGCVPTMPVGMTSAPAPLPRESYMPMDFQKWSSGLYGDQFIGKPVIVEGYFMKLQGMAGHAIQASDINFYVIEKSIAQQQKAAQQAARRGAPTYQPDAQPGLVSITAPLSMRDVIYSIQDQQRVRVYGVVVEPLSKYALPASWRSVMATQLPTSPLQVRADQIEIVR